MVRSSSLGRLRDGRVDTFRLPRANARPYTLAADRDGNIWYADISGYVGMLPMQYARRL
jgi:virginiamycin B lyase